MPLTAPTTTTTGLPRTKQPRELTLQALERLATLEGWRAWLSVRAALPQLSLPNQLLVALQHPQATHLATFRAWRNRGYVVRRRPDGVPEGQYAIRVWEPKPASRAQLQQWRAAGSDPCAYPHAVFRLTNAFAQDQVAPIEDTAQRVCLDPIVRDLDGADLAPILPALIALVTELGVTAEAPPGPVNLAVARLCGTVASCLVAADAAAVHQPGADADVAAAAVSWVCIRGLGLDPDALDSTNGVTAATASLSLVPLQTATVVDRLARHLENVLPHDAAATPAA